MPIGRLRWGLRVSSAAVEIAAYRIAVEAMTNATRHSQAQRCEVVVEVSAGEVQVTVSDDGLGIDPALVTCDEDNTGSIRVIEAAGGVLEDVRGVKRRYWVPTG